jgi:hypothetical protein
MKHLLLISIVMLVGILGCQGAEKKMTSSPSSQAQEHKHEIGQVCPGCGGKHFKVTYKDGRPSELQCAASYCNIQFKSNDGGESFQGQGDYAKDMVIKDAKIPSEK